MNFIEYRHQTNYGGMFVFPCWLLYSPRDGAHNHKKIGNLRRNISTLLLFFSNKITHQCTQKIRGRLFIDHLLKFIIIILEVRGPSGPQLLVGGPSGQLDLVLRALRALRMRLTYQMHAAACSWNFVTNGRTNKAILGVGFPSQL